MSDSNLSYVSTIVLTNGLNSAGPTTTRQPGFTNNNNNNSASLTSIATTTSTAAAGPGGSGVPGVPGAGGASGPGVERSHSVSIVGLDNRSYSFQNLRGFPPDNSNYNNNYDETAPDTQSRELIIDPSSNFPSESSSKLKDWSWGMTAWTVIACILCPGFPYCTVPAVLCNVFAYVDHVNKDYEGKRKKMWCAIGWSLAAFVAGIVTVFIVLIVLFVAYDAKNWNTIPTVPGSDFFM